MSFAKYAQFYKDNGFFAGSKIKTTVTDGTFVGEQLVLSKGNTILKTTTIPTSGKVEFFTDESGTLTISSNNGSATITATVNVTNYATYNVTLHGISSDNSREVFADDVIMDGDTASTNIAYTGDVSAISVAVSNPDLVRATVSENKVNFTDAGKDMMGKCSIIATVAATDKYKSGNVTFYINKLSGKAADWVTADDESIAKMVDYADKGELNLNDYWHVGDTRKVKISAIDASGSIMIDQPEQEIELVLMYDCLLDNKYNLTSPTQSQRTRPSFIVGQKNCLANLSPIELATISDSITTSDTSTTKTVELTSRLPIVANSVSVFETYLNEKYFDSLPEHLKPIFKYVNVRFCALNLVKNASPAGYANYGCVRTNNGIKSQRVVLPSSYEICQDSVTVKKEWKSGSGSITSGDGLMITGNSIYTGNEWTYFENNDSYESQLISHATTAFDYSYEGTQLPYYSTANNRIKYKGTTQQKCNYYTRTTGDFHMDAVKTAQGRPKAFNLLTRGVALMNTSGAVSNFIKENNASVYAGISPIMFI